MATEGGNSGGGVFPGIASDRNEHEWTLHLENGGRHLFERIAHAGDANIHGLTEDAPAIGCCRLRNGKQKVVVSECLNPYAVRQQRCWRLEICSRSSARARRIEPRRRHEVHTAS